MGKQTTGRLRWLTAARGMIGGLLVLSLLLFGGRLARTRLGEHIVASDGIGYYSFLRSAAIDGDLRFENEYEHYGLARRYWEITPTGRVANKYAVGSAILWLPFFLAAHGIALAGRALGLGIAVDGYGYLYEGAIAIGSIVYGGLGFGLAFRCARRLVTERAVLFAVGLLWLASNAIYYMVFEPSMAHMPALFSVALALSIWFPRLRGKELPSAADGAALGVASGLVLLVRLQDAPFLLLPYGYGLVRGYELWRAGLWRQARRWLGITALAGVIGVVCFMPQMIAWRIVYGTWLASPYAAERSPAFFWLSPQVGNVLFAPFHGLFTWHPVYLLATVGLLLVARKDRLLGTGMLVVVAAQTYVVASWWAWWQGASFGGRMFLSGMWIYVVGLAALTEAWQGRKRGGWTASVLGVGLVGWNVLAVLQYRLNLVPGDLPLTWEQVTVERVELAGALLRRVFSQVGF